MLYRCAAVSVAEGVGLAIDIDPVQHRWVVRDGRHEASFRRRAILVGVLYVEACESVERWRDVWDRRLGKGLAVAIFAGYDPHLLQPFLLAFFVAPLMLRVQAYLVVSQNDDAVVHLVGKFIARVAGREDVEFYHARLVGGFFILLLLVRDAFGDACDDGDGGNAAAEEESEGDECHGARLCNLL